MIEDAAKNAVIGQVILIFSGIMGSFFAFFLWIIGFGVFLLGMSGFSDVFGEPRIFRFTLLAGGIGLFSGILLLAGLPRMGFTLLAVAYLFEIAANYLLYVESGVPAIIWGYVLMLIGIPLLAVGIGTLLILAGRIMVIYGYHSIPEIYRVKRRAREHVGLA
ncbi:hypothetical protein A3L11_02985 [Thermococcus siculi]|uniref:Uncharacterized protein n=1 Tax=Thermococcus siculi TaxID=72803 RepID=A0A2Z2MKS3_9EURY|nr:hypothetical protein [Thermococcus siculi]ASJ08245.1 hypothetical protein A3L11_02985 [Thermococcus siculi]